MWYEGIFNLLLSGQKIGLIHRRLTQREVVCVSMEQKGTSASSSTKGCTPVSSPQEKQPCSMKDCNDQCNALQIRALVYINLINPNMRPV